MEANDTFLAVDARNLKKHFGSVHAVDGVSLTVAPGEIVALLGPNGAGKTTTIDMILGLQKPDSGTVRVFGMTPDEAIGRGLIGATQQTPALPSMITVRALLANLASTMRLHRPIDEVASETGITEFLGRKIGKCSGGELRRVALAAALLSDPLLLFLDEPTVALDVEARASFWDLMKVQATRGRTILFATHYLTEAQNAAQRTLILKHGRIIADGPTAQLTENHAGSTLTISYTCSDEEARAALADAGTDLAVKAEDGHAHVTGHDLDDVARAALALPGARGLALEHSTIEDAYLALTKEDAHS